MAHLVRTEGPQRDDRAVERDAESICIDLRQGDLSDDEVVSLLVQLARQRAESGESTNGQGATASDHLLDHYPAAASAPPPQRRRRWMAPAAVACALALAAALVLGVRSRQDDGGSEPAGPTDPTGAGTEAGPAAAATAAAAMAPEVTIPTSSVRDVREPVAATTPTATELGAGTEAERAESFCKAAAVYSVDDLTTLAENGVRDPRATIAAYATMVANAPPEIADDVTALGPITGKVQAEIERGAITTPQQMQQYLAGGAPSDEVQQWIVAQQAIVAELPTLCPDNPTP